MSTKKYNNEWKNYLNMLNYYNVNDICLKFVNQLKLDEEKYNQGTDVSDCALNTPRSKSSINKKFNIAYILATTLYPMKEGKDILMEKRWSYMQYQRLISKLSKAFKVQLERDEQIKNEYKEIRKTHVRKNFCELKKKSLSDLIINPTPMTVEVSPIEDLQPFYNFLSSNDVVINGYKEFKRGIQYDDGRMDLCKQVVGPPHIDALMEALGNNTQIEHFLLGNNIIGMNGALAISKFLKISKSKIKTWYLAGNELDSNCIQLISEALKDDDVCNALWLKRNPLKPEGGKYISELLKYNKYIKVLDLQNTGILDEGIRYIFEGLKDNNTLRQLYLDANGITVQGAKYISRYFDYLVENNIKGITSLWLSINRIDDEGVILLSESLKNYKYLKRLCIGSNRISDIGISSLYQSLVNHENLIVLDIGLYKSTSDLQELPNNIGDLGAKWIAKFIEHNKSLKVLSILHNNISNEGLEEINISLQKNKTLLSLYYEQYGLDILPKLKHDIKNKLKENIQNNLGLSYTQFMNNNVRFIKGSKKLRFIDSNYRNNM